MNENFAGVANSHCRFLAYIHTFCLHWLISFPS